MPEGGGFQVKSHSHLIRLALLEQGEQNVQKAIDGVGVTSVLGGQQLDIPTIRARWEQPFPKP